jgi:hypothetical protein
VPFDPIAAAPAPSAPIAAAPAPSAPIATASRRRSRARIGLVVGAALLVAAALVGALSYRHAVPKTAPRASTSGP